jgi:phosphate transport system substrate-binding protein
VKRTILGRAALPAAVVLAFGLAACAPANEEPGDDAPAAGGESVSGTIAGAGATSQSAAMEAWIAAFNDANPDATVSYDPVGSGGGRESFSDGSVAFAGSDAYMDEDEIAAATEQCGDVIEMPNYVSPIAVIYNLEGVEDLNMSAATIAGIFAGTITSWDAPEIAAENPDATLPATPIVAVHRSDDSGTTDNFTDYLFQSAGDVWTSEPDGVWPLQSGEGANGSSGVVDAVTAGDGYIGYVDLSRAGDLGVVNVQVGEEFVEPTPEAAAAVVDASAPVEGRGEYDYAIDIARDTTEAGVYPIILVSYHLACTTYEDQETADTVKAFLSYIISEEGQTASAEAAGSAPISEDARTKAQAAIDAISAG